MMVAGHPVLTTPPSKRCSLYEKVGHSRRSDTRQDYASRIYQPTETSATKTGTAARDFDALVRQVGVHYVTKKTPRQRGYRALQAIDPGSKYRDMPTDPSPTLSCNYGSGGGKHFLHKPGFSFQHSAVESGTVWNDNPCNAYPEEPSRHSPPSLDHSRSLGTLDLSKPNIVCSSTHRFPSWKAAMTQKWSAVHEHKARPKLGWILKCKNKTDEKTDLEVIHDVRQLLRPVSSRHDLSISDRQKDSNKLDSALENYINYSDANHKVSFEYRNRLKCGNPSKNIARCKSENSNKITQPNFDESGTLVSLVNDSPTIDFSTKTEEMQDSVNERPVVILNVSCQQERKQTGGNPPPNSPNRFSSLIEHNSSSTTIAQLEHAPFLSHTTRTLEKDFVCGSDVIHKIENARLKLANRKVQCSNSIIPAHLESLSKKDECQLSPNSKLASGSEAHSGSDTTLPNYVGAHNISLMSDIKDVFQGHHLLKRMPAYKYYNLDKRRETTTVGSTAFNSQHNPRTMGADCAGVCGDRDHFEYDLSKITSSMKQVTENGLVRNEAPRNSLDQEKLRRICKWLDEMHLSNSKRTK